MRAACLLSLLLLLLFPASVLLPADAQTPKRAAPPKLTLAQVLTAQPPQAGSLRLAVGAEKVILPGDAAPPPAGASDEEIAAAFGGVTQRFGSVAAIAPATMTLLNPQPGPPNIAANLAGFEAIKLLAASLDDAQWQALISDGGLGLADLNGETQRGLFHALFRNHQLWVASDDPALHDLPPSRRSDIRDVTGEIDATRIRLGQTAKMYLHDRQGKTIYYSGARPDSPQRLHTYRPPALPAQTLPPTSYSVALKAAFPNTPKLSDLEWDSKALQVPVSTAGVKTVGDLVSRAGQRAGLELYADPHYAAKQITLSGPPAAAPAADLLRALCLCVTGTFRKVGPAYVLTDDLAGVGTRRQHLADWEQQAQDASTKIGDEAGAVMLKRRASDARKLRGFGDPVALTPGEFAALPDDPAMPGIPMEADSPGGGTPFATLTPAQQTWARQTAASYNEKRHTGKLPEYLSGDELDDADLTHTVSLGAKYQTQLLVPSLNSPVDTNYTLPLFMLYYPGDTPESNTAYADSEAKKRALLPPAPPLSALLHRGSRRGVIGHPRTAADVGALIAAMQKLGLNTLWLDVFSGGVSHVKASSGTDILAEALAKTHGLGIEVSAVISLLTWGDAAPDGIRDLTIDGRDSRQAAPEWLKHRKFERTDEDGYAVSLETPPVVVSSADPAVIAALTAVVQDCAARPGLAGFVWDNADAGSSFGYTPALRLAFLRAAHADPVDIDPGSDLGAAAALPLFDDDALDSSLSDLWLKFRTDADVSLLRRLYAAGHCPGLPALTQQDEIDGDDWLASWDNPAKLPPTVRDLAPDTPPTSAKATVRLLKQASRIVIRRKSIRRDADTAALTRKLDDSAKALPADGFVLDFSSDAVTQGAAPLDSLVRAVSSQKAVK